MTNQQTILITGAAQRVGLHCAQRLAADGFRVIITCRRPRPQWQDAPPDNIEVLLADFSTEAGIQALIDTLVSRRIQLRALIHNASEWMDDENQADAFQRMFMVHMQAPYLLNLACAELFDPAMTGDIIHISDHVAQRGSARHIAYSATKAGLESLSRSFAARFAPHIKVNAIAPALIMFNEGDTEAYREKALAKSALGIEPGPDVVYQSIRYLLDNPYVTGTCLDLNGGRNLK
ncbi:dihydromonapterin reductase [Pseudomonas saudimassiliensis]|uniref:Dihydromonapterin reductase n=1 Tax=Pseudomonas saudimassiliensis TaxID=1461581 RepID=A0A078LZZ9_9PSED|nr:dihydromonapterin reductase [Pseudomonas saudimassiliensis]CEA00663.1 dihydromonapterin reductase [Pseudomonas saudimassiliensis]CEF25226.1 dihydromonapterin reductase [Pseudomonas saudimassiliensis]